MDTVGAHTFTKCSTSVTFWDHVNQLRAKEYNNHHHIIIIIICTSSCARSARFATCARSSLRSPCLDELKVQLIVILCCGVVYDCSHTADTHDVVMKGVTCYKDASEHDWVFQWEQWCPCPRWRAARCGQLDDSIQVWRPVVESAWWSSPPHPRRGGGLYQGQSALALLLSRVSASLLVALSTWSSPTQTSISFPMIFFYFDNLQIYTRMRITGRFKGCFLSVHMVNF